MTQAAAGERKDKMKHVNLADIIVGERFRSDFGDMEDFIASIQDKGIIQPLTVDENMNLLAGGRRFAGATAAGLKRVPVIVRAFVNETDSREIELMENIHRKDFTWAEVAKLTAEIDRLYRSKNMDWSGRKTAELLDKGVGTVARNLQLATAMEIIPELGDCKTADDALKMLKKLEGDAITHELRQRQVAAVNAPDSETVGMKRGLKDMLKIADANYHIGDVFQSMVELRTNGFINLIECDPPYGIELNKQKASKDSVTSTVTSYEEVPTDEYDHFLEKLTKELFRVAGKDCWLVFWFGPTWQHQVLTYLRAAGWIVDEIPAIWSKTQGQTLQPELYLARTYEPFFLCRKGNPVLIKRGRSNVFSYPGCPTSGANAKYHPTQRPTALIEDILETLTAGRSNIFIPFLGSGATLRACYNLGFAGWGNDLNPEYKTKFMLAVEEDSRKLLAPEKPNVLED